MPARHIEIRRARLVGDFGRSIEQVPHGLHVDEALADRAVYPAKRVERAEELEQKAVDPYCVTGRETAAAPAPDREDHCPGHHHISDQRLADVEPGEAD